MVEKEPLKTDEPEMSPVEQLQISLTELKTQLGKYDDLVAKLADAQVKREAAKSKLQSVESESLDDIDPLDKSALQLIEKRRDSKKLYELRNKAAISESLVALFEKAISHQKAAVFQTGAEAVKLHQGLYYKVYTEIHKQGERLLAENFEYASPVSREIEDSYRPLIKLSETKMDSSLFHILPDNGKLNQLRAIFDKSEKLFALIESSSTE